MGNLKSNIYKIAVILILLVAMSIYFVFGLYGKYTSDKNNNGGANVAGIKCEINVSDTSDPNEYRYFEVSDIVGNANIDAYAVAVPVRISSTNSEVSYSYTVTLGLASPKERALERTSFICPTSNINDATSIGISFAQGNSYVKGPTSSSYQAGTSSAPVLSGSLDPDEAHVYWVVVFSSVPGTAFPEDYIVTYTLNAVQEG